MGAASSVMRYGVRVCTMLRSRLLVRGEVKGLVGLLAMLSLFIAVPALMKPPSKATSAQAARAVTPKRRAPQQRSIYFVRVGKAGGTSIDNALMLGCSYNWTCVNYFLDKRANGTESMLSRQVVQIGHMEDVTLDHSIEGGLRFNITSYLFNLRNPIERIVSAYDFAMPRNTDEPFRTEEGFENATIGPHIGQLHPKRYQFYHDCFPSWSKLMNAINASDTNSTSCECQRFAVDVFQGRAWDANLGANMVRNLSLAPKLRGFDHFYQNYMRCTNLTFYANPGTEVLVVRTESLWDDLKQLDRFLGGRGELEGEGIHFSHGSETKPIKTKPPKPRSKEAVNLCCILHKDIRVYQDVMVRARNLQNAQKLKSMQKVFAQCDISLWSSTDEGHWDDIRTFSWNEWSRENCPMMPTRLCQARPTRRRLIA